MGKSRDAVIEASRGWYGIGGTELVDVDVDVDVGLDEGVGVVEPKSDFCARVGVVYGIIRSTFFGFWFAVSSVSVSLSGRVCRRTSMFLSSANFASRIVEFWGSKERLVMA